MDARPAPGQPRDYPMTIVDEASEITPEMWDRLARLEGRLSRLDGMLEPTPRTAGRAFTRAQESSPGHPGLPRPTPRPFPPIRPYPPIPDHRRTAVKRILLLAASAALGGAWAVLWAFWY
jgi:hypothetical protein